ncbi:hypothetical protein KOW79_005031 [Hemibagrus wyckioides]|uniref:Uncharacterized protein n=1 Tax=Hemibagrus wyckioides TaxID=337641 RepID=A0A9D3NYU9_9TELE|nr:hypothetical protein KOW79_005031 [Hemibagrus wyckioides]
MLLLEPFSLLARRSKQAAHKGAEPEQGNGEQALHYRDPVRYRLLPQSRRLHVFQRRHVSRMEEQFREDSPSAVFSFRRFFCAPTHPRPPCSRVETHKRRRRRRVTARFPYSASVASARRRTSSASRAWSCDGSLIGAATRFKPHPRPCGRSAEDFQTRISA